MEINAANRLWVIGAVLLSVAIVAMGWFLGISPKLSEAAASTRQRADVAAANVVHESEVAQIKKEFSQLRELQDQLSVLRAAVPADDALSTFIGELHTLEQQNGVQLTDITTSDGQAYTPAKNKNSRAVTTNPLITPDNFVAIAVNVTATGPQPQVLGFIKGLQTGTRLFLVTNLTLGQDASSPVFKGTVTGFVYVLLDHPAPAATKGGTPSPAPSGK